MDPKGFACLTELWIAELHEITRRYFTKETFRVSIEIKSPLRPLGREGTPVVPPRLTPATKQKSLCDATGRKSQRHSFQVRRTAEGVRVYPCSITGAPELGYL